MHPEAPRPRADLLIVNAAEIITGEPAPGDPRGRRTGAALAVAGGRVLAIGPEPDLRRAYDWSTGEVLDAAGLIAAPGFVDSHTHLVFGGSRVREYAARLPHTPPPAKTTWRSARPGAWPGCWPTAQPRSRAKAATA